VCGADDETFGALDVSGSTRQGNDLSSVLWPITRPVGEDLPGADGVELFDTSEQHDADGVHGLRR
jgi:hypothetical protein